MKVHELYSAVAKLGFEDSLEDISAFFFAANRAMLQVNALRPLTAILEIYHRSIKNLIPGATHEIYEHLDSNVVFESPDPAKAYYFEVLGEGECRIEVYNSILREWETKGKVEFNCRTYTAYYALIKPDGSFVTEAVRLNFLGDYVYHIKNVALYGSVYSSDPEDIPPFQEYIRYDLSKLADGFIELADNPFVTSFTRTTEDYIFEDGRVLLFPSDVAGEVKIKYKKTPRALVYVDDPTDDDSEIELDPELAQLLPLLTAVYVWADEGDGKSEYYMQLYRERASEIEMRRRSREEAKYANVTGW